MPGRNIIVIGCSAGGVEALSRLVGRLPADLPAAVLVVMHVSAAGTSVLPQILSKAGPLPAHHVQSSEPIAPGRIYVAPPDVHMVVRDGRVAVEKGPRQNGHRPAIDPLFRSAAYEHRERVVGVVLSGTRDDGSAGLVAVRRHGGVAVVQEPDDALFQDMPRNALEIAGADHVLAVEQIAELLARLAREDPPTPGGESMARDVNPPVRGRLEAEARSVFVCPECHGPLTELHDHGVMRFECRIGHAYTSETLMALQYEAMESALWAAVNALEERAELSRRMARRARERGHRATAIRYEEQAEDNEERVATLRKLLYEGLDAPPPPPADEEDAGEGRGRKK